MKKSSTVAVASKKNFDQRLTIGLDLGDRSSWVLRAGRSWRSCGREETGHDSESNEGSLRGHASQPGSIRDGHALVRG